MSQSPILLDSTTPIRGRSNRYVQVMGGQEFESARSFGIVDPHNDGDTTVAINRPIFGTKPTMWGHPHSQLGGSLVSDRDEIRSWGPIALSKTTRFGLLSLRGRHPVSVSGQPDLQIARADRRFDCLFYDKTRTSENSLNLENAESP
jgi:hypothetical protein